AAGGPQIRQTRRARRRVAVLNPLVEIASGQAAHIGRNVRRGAGQATEAHEFVCAETVWIEPLGTFDGGAILRRPRVGPEAGAARAVAGRADAVTPIVAVGEAAARPADHRRLDLPQVVDQRLPDATDVGDLRVLADPNAVVDDAPEVLDEVTVDFGRDGRDRLVHENLETRVGGLRARRRRVTRQQRSGNAGCRAADERA